MGSALGNALLPTWGLCFSHSAGMSLCTVWYSTGISYTCRSTLSPRPSFSSSWEERQGCEDEGAAWGLPVPRHQAAQPGVAHQGHTALGRWRQEQEVILCYIEKLKAALAARDSAPPQKNWVLTAHNPLSTSIHQQFIR